MALETERFPSEDWVEYVRRLEAERLRVIGENKQKEAEALERIPQGHKDLETKTTAKAKRAAAEEFFKAVKEIERGGE